MCPQVAHIKYLSDEAYHGLHSLPVLLIYINFVFWWGSTLVLNFDAMLFLWCRYVLMLCFKIFSNIINRVVWITVLNSMTNLTSNCIVLSYILKYNVLWLVQSYYMTLVPYYLAENIEIYDTKVRYIQGLFEPHLCFKVGKHILLW